VAESCEDAEVFSVVGENLEGGREFEIRAGAFGHPVEDVDAVRDVAKYGARVSAEGLGEWSIFGRGGMEGGGKHGLEKGEAEAGSEAAKDGAAFQGISMEGGHGIYLVRKGSEVTI
jgi:hypothetical protein